MINATLLVNGEQDMTLNTDWSWLYNTKNAPMAFCRSLCIPSILALEI